MSNIIFTHSKDDGQKWNHDAFKLNHELVYVSIEAGDEGGSAAGWVSQEVRRLIHAAPCNQRKVNEHEALLRKLNLLLADEKFDDASDLIRDELRAIDGPSE